MDVNLHLSLVTLNNIIKNGCNQFVFSPGARNSPLIRALFILSDKYKLEIESHFDERGAAFFALGIAKRMNCPVTMITTSGSAVANLFPAVIEARYSDTPLILITADRPIFLHKISANQTIDQEHFFKQYVEADLMIGDFQRLDEQAEQNLIEELYKVQSSLKYGPIHINFPFDEPLLEMDLRDTFNKEINQNISAIINKDFKSSQNHTYNNSSKQNISLPKEIIEHFFNSLQRTVKGFIVVGELNQSYKKKDILELLQIFMDWGWFVILEVNSGMRHFFKSNTDVDNRVLFNYNFFLENERICKILDFDTVVHIGGRLINKSLSNFFKKNKQLNYIHINHSVHNYNPEGCVKSHYEFHPPHFCRSMVDIFLSTNESWSIKSLMKKPIDFKLTYNHWVKNIDNALNSFINNYTFDVFNELEISRILSQFSKKSQDGKGDVRLFLGNSMPIRDFNLMGMEVGFSQIYCNRGASGIDGLIATAAGVAKGCDYGLERESLKPRFYVLIGDLSTLHDLNSLVFCKKNQDLNIPMTLIVINNQEGTIFRYLPIAKVINQYPGYRDFYYAHQFNFEDFAKGMGINYQKITSALSFSKALYSLKYVRESCLVELKVNGNFNQNVHTKYHNDILHHIDYLIDQN